MWAYSRLAIIVLGFVGIAACEKDNLASPDAGFSCSVNDDCTMGSARVCDVEGDKTCVECLPGAATTTCMGMTPVCDANRSCRACKAHSDCASDACLPDGSCAMESQVGYVVAGGTGTNCDKSAPCGNISTAIDKTNATTRNIIRVTGVIENTNVDLDNRIRIFLGSPGAALRGGQNAGGSNDMPIMRVRGISKIAVYDLSFNDARRVAIRVEDASAELMLARSQVIGAGQEGISSTAKVTVLQSDISGGKSNASPGISIMNGGELIMDRSRVTMNEGGGINVANGGEFTITNSFIVGNRNGGGLFTITPANNSRLEFNTIVDNNAAGTTQAGGVVCDNANVSARNNIIYRNTGGTGGMQQKNGACVFANSFEMPAVATDDTLKFKGDTATPKDYHLTAASPSMVRDVSGVTCADLKDYDGEDRPQGAGCDLGADEVK